MDEEDIKSAAELMKETRGRPPRASRNRRSNSPKAPTASKRPAPPPNYMPTGR
jgi:hypothetical protein